MIILVPLLSAVSAATIFSTAGYLTHGTTIDPLTAFSGATGPITPLVAYSEALARIWGGPFIWSMVIFAALFLSTATAAVSLMKCLWQVRPVVIDVALMITILRNRKNQVVRV